MADTFRADDITPDVLAHMERADRWYKAHPGEATPREWYEPSAVSERARDAGPREERAPRRTRGSR
jgi:hypothetical protein